jgi:DNA-binding HxlR family transcriptional regulator
MEKDSCLQDVERYKKRSLALKDALELLSGKWKLNILLHLYHHGASRFKDLQEGCISISPKVLSKELHDLETNKLITRTVNNTKPVTVSYAITTHAMAIEPVITALVAFGQLHRDKIISDL